MLRPEALLEIERDRLLNAVHHLERTNREIKEILATSGPDRDLRQAVGENIVVIAKYKGQIERLEQEIRKARGVPVDVSSGQTVAVPVQDSMVVESEQDCREVENKQGSENKEDQEGGLWL